MWQGKEPQKVPHAIPSLPSTPPAFRRTVTHLLFGQRLAKLHATAADKEAIHVGDHRLDGRLFVRHEQPIRIERPVRIPLQHYCTRGCPGRAKLRHSLVGQGGAVASPVECGWPSRYGVSEPRGVQIPQGRGACTREGDREGARAVVEQPSYQPAEDSFGAVAERQSGCNGETPWQCGVRASASLRVEVELHESRFGGATSLPASLLLNRAPLHKDLPEEPLGQLHTVEPLLFVAGDRHDAGLR